MINNSETKPTRSLRSLRWPAAGERCLQSKPGGCSSTRYHAAQLTRAVGSTEQ
ncbi:hypothetical protein EVAR_91749_1, partial [Eumeta japonica]